MSAWITATRISGGALAPPLILVAVIPALMTAEFRGRIAGRMAQLLVLNTLVAILIGIGVATVVQPGKHANLKPRSTEEAAAPATPEDQRILDLLKARGYKPAPVEKPKDPLALFLDNIPDSLLRPLVENNKVLGVIFVAVAFGLALRPLRRRRIETVEGLLDVAFTALLTVLHWVIQLVPIGVFGIVASIVGHSGFGPFIGLGAFIGAVLLALFLQACYYLTRVKFASWVCPGDLLRGCRDALVMAFSTASSTVTMPLTFECLRDRVRIREESASMGALVGANFNNDGTALYEGMSALFISQMLGHDLGPIQMVLVVLTSVAASVGAAGIPEAGLVTMTLVFSAVGLPTEYIALLLTVDWFLDRCRTAINVMGDMNVSCILDGKTPPVHEAHVHSPEPAPS
jgi:Na+/H+-dicarboxylate symporter